MLYDSKLARQRKLAALTGLALNYGKELPAELTKLWMRLLEKHDAEVVELACEKVVTEYEYKTLPPFAVIAKAIRQVSGELEPEQAREVAANEEWETLLASAGKYGRYNKPALDERTDAAIRAMGGWDAVCDWTQDSLPWKRKEFLEHWMRHAEHGDIMALPARDILALGCRQTARESTESARKQQNAIHIGGALVNALNAMGRAS